MMAEDTTPKCENLSPEYGMSRETLRPSHEAAAVIFILKQPTLLFRARPKLVVHLSVLDKTIERQALV